jgi:hypothetical protein
MRFTASEEGSGAVWRGASIKKRMKAEVERLKGNDPNYAQGRF